MQTDTAHFVFVLLAKEKSKRSWQSTETLTNAIREFFRSSILYGHYFQLFFFFILQCFTDFPWMNKDHRNKHRHRS